MGASSLYFLLALGAALCAGLALGQGLNATGSVPFRGISAFDGTDRVFVAPKP